uniref:Cell division cycle associated 7b n=1 Tax=Labrus bergylta TaxID=56723 RepID=A0A3Q3GGW1_9LABR
MLLIKMKLLYVCQQTPCFKSKFITEDLTHLFSQSDSEEEFQGFSEDEEEEATGSLFFGVFQRLDSEEDSDMDTGFYSDGEDAAPPKRKSLLVALRCFCFFNLFLYSVIVQKKKRAQEKATARKRKFEPKVGSERRNPSRKARPPENFAVEEKSEPLRVPRTVNIRRLVLVRYDTNTPHSRKSHSSTRVQYVVRSVDEITKEDLDNIAYRSKDKIWDKENGSSCHQCRQKTLDTKTVCRSGVCVGVKGQFCGPCLKNRYGEDVHDVLLDPDWSCPICRGVCNCSLCRKKEGRCATGILVGLARYNGHDNVHEYLESIQKEVQ